MINTAEFKTILRNRSLSDIYIVQKYITFGNSYIFENEEMYFNLKKIIADNFHLTPSEIVMVGSAKLGFSINPKQLWKPIDDDSDIDMVIISDIIFDQFWRELYEFNIDIKSRTEEEQKKYFGFLKYLFKGWVRPDLFPFRYQRKKGWEDFFKSISYKEFGKRKITGAIYRNLFFFENYHKNNIKQIRLGEIQ